MSSSKVLYIALRTRVAVGTLPLSSRVLTGACRHQLPVAATYRAVKLFHSSFKKQDQAAKPIFIDENEVLERILGVLKNFEKVDPIKVSPGARFKDDLGLDSLDTVEVIMAIEDEFAIVIPDDEADSMVCVKDAVAFVASHPQSQ